MANVPVIQRPPGFDLFALQGFKGINTKAKRPAIEDQEFSWSENIMPIGGANARMLYGAAPAIYTTSGGLTIINLCFYNIGATDYGIVFLSDGSADQFNLATGAVVQVGPAGTFWSSGDTPTIAQFSNSGILIVSTVSANAYWAWDGVLWPPGNPTSPTWLNGGTPTAMPTGIAGTDIEVFLSRVWIINGTTRLTSVASNGADFSTGSGGVSATSTDSTLRVKYTALQQANGYLYFFGDSQTAYVTNVQTTSTPTTTYQYTVIDQQIGTPWRDSVVPFGRSILFANSNGIYALYGSSANKISDPLDGIWEDSVADFATVIPSAAVETIFGIKTFMISVSTIDPTTQEQRTLLAMFDGKKWFMGSQIPAPILIAPQETDSHLEAFGTNGRTVYDLFDTPSSSLPKVMQSKLWGGEYGYLSRKQALRFYTEVEALNNTSVDINMSLDTEVIGQPLVTQFITFVNNSGGALQFRNNGLGNLFWTVIPTGNIQVSFGQNLVFVNVTGGILQFVNNSGGDLNFQTAASISYNDLSGSGLLLGFTITTTSPDFILMSAAIGYVAKTLLY